MEQDVQLYIAIISKDNDIENIQTTVENLKNNECNENEFIVAIKKEESQNEEIKEYLKQNNIKIYEYSNLKDVYYDMLCTVEYDYVSFINSGDTYTKNFKTKLINRFREDAMRNNLYISPILYNKIKYALNKTIDKGKSVDIEKNPEKIWIHLNSAWISKKILSKVVKPNRDDLKYYIDINLLLKLTILNGGYEIIRNVKLNSINKFEDINESKIENYDINWYKNVFFNIEDVSKFSNEKYGADLQYLQYAYMYLIKNIINTNVNAQNKHILVDCKLNEFWENVKKVSLSVEDEIIMQMPGNKLVNYYILLKKYGLEYKDIDYRTFENKIHIIKNNKILFNASDTKIKILLIDYTDEKLVITANYPFPFNENKLKIFATYLGKKIYAKKNDLYSDYKAFGKQIYANYTFDLEIPLKEKNEKQYINFFLEEQNTIVPLDINFSKPLSRLCKSKFAYWNCGKFTLNYRKNSILVLKNNKLRHIKREILYIISLLKSKDKDIKKIGRLRIIYHITKPLFRKEIWLFEDKIYKAGDNGEYMYTYASKQKDGIKKYYILKEDCLDAKRFKKEHKKFVKYGSLKQKLLFLNCDILFETHNNAVVHYGFKDNEKYLRDLFNSTNVCIQHGLSVQFIPNLVNRINDNLKLFFLASPIEKANIENKEYAYENHLDVLKITGSPRYDGLKNNDKRQILITPTWRNYLAAPVSNIASQRSHNNNFKKSDYYKIYNSLINNKKLIEVAKKTGYKIIYLLHPCTSPQIDDFDKNEDVELIAATDDLNYEKILTESSLMVTDYSGVQFDFAYMYKPIVYFHPDELPPSYDEGEYKYETMALGEIVKKSDELVNVLCEYMQNNCKIKNEYKERIDKFFKYHDYNNCKRIYDEIMKYRKLNGEIHENLRKNI